MTFLDKSVINRFRSEFEDASFLHKETEYERIPPLCYAFLSRMDSCMKYLNEHSKLPRDEIEILLFFVYSCWILDGVKQILFLLHSSSAEKYDYKVLEKKYNDIISKDQLASKRYFRIKVDCRRFSSDSAVSSFTVKITPRHCPDTCECESLDKCPFSPQLNISDDDIIKYLRSLIFAHPFETERSSICQIDKDVQVSPYAIPGLLVDEPNDIVVRIYSGLDQSYDRRIAFSFSALKDYIRSRYSLINVATEKIRQISDEKKSQWKRRRVKRGLPPIGILNNIKEILDERSEGWLIDSIDSAIEYLSCEITVEENEEIIKEYRDKIISIIPKLRNAVNKMNYKVMNKQLSEVLEAHAVLAACSQHEDKKVGYQIAKIFDYLRGTRSSPEWDYHIACGYLDEAKAFAKGFAQKWVTLKPYEMDFCEIRLLVSIACYYECELCPLHSRCPSLSTNRIKYRRFETRRHSRLSKKHLLKSERPKLWRMQIYLVHHHNERAKARQKQPEPAAEQVPDTPEPDYDTEGIVPHN